MKFNEYQNEATKFSVMRGKDLSMLMYLTLGIVSEAGELADQVKKNFRDGTGKINPEIRNKLKGELGDVLWYVSELSNMLEFDFEDVAKYNLQKLTDRKERGVIQGDGDIR